jgi:hypothetical protein
MDKDLSSFREASLFTNVVAIENPNSKFANLK